MALLSTGFGKRLDYKTTSWSRPVHLASTEKQRMAMSSISCILRLSLLVLTSSQRLDSPDGDCDGGFVCKSTQDCPSYLVKKEQADSLKSQGAAEYEAVLKELKDMVCNKAKRGVCCEESFEVVNGKIVTSVGEMPFIARLSLKTGMGSSSICGATLIASQFLLSAKHCFRKQRTVPFFYDECIYEQDCGAHFRDLRVSGLQSHDQGQFYIPIVDIFEKSGLSDLVVVKLKHPVEEHEDYGLGAPLQPIQLARKAPKAGEVIVCFAFSFLSITVGRYRT